MVKNEKEDNLTISNESSKSQIKIIKMAQVFDFSVFVRNKNKVEELAIKNVKPSFYVFYDDIPSIDVQKFLKSELQKKSLADVVFVIEYKFFVNKPQVDYLSNLDKDEINSLLLELFNRNLVIKEPNVYVSETYPLVICNDDPRFRILQ